MTSQTEFVEPEFTVKVIREAIKTLQQFLGDNVVDAIIADLELYGLLAKDQELFSIEQIHTALERMFGEAASFLMRPIADALLKDQVSLALPT